MPLYEYVCSNCGCEFELLRSLSEAEKDAPCPECHSSAERILSTFACFTRSDSGVTSPVSGGSSCSSCGSSSCSTCHP
ncbi:FmdB family zinc ribbon protein [Chloroflexota bacterium]